MVSGQLASRKLDTSRAQTSLHPALENSKVHKYPRRSTLDTSFRDFRARPRISTDHARTTHQQDQQWPCSRTRWPALHTHYAHYIHHPQPISSVVKCVFVLQDASVAKGRSTRRSLASHSAQKAGNEDLPCYLGSLGGLTSAVVTDRYKPVLCRSHGGAANVWATTLLV